MCISRVYRFIQFLEIAFSRIPRTKENQSFPFTFPLSRQIFHHFEELSLSLSLQVEFIPWDIINVLSLGRASMKKGKKVAFIIRHISTLSSRMFLSGMEQRLDPRIHVSLFFFFPFESRPIPLLPRIVFNERRSLKFGEFSGVKYKGVERFCRWSIFESVFDRHRKCRAWMKPRQCSTRVSNEPIKPRKWWSRVIFVSHMMWCDIQLMDNRWDSAWYVCHFSVKFYFRWKLFLQLLFDNVKTSGKMKIICSIIATWFFHTNILLARLIIECTHYT